ncbi:hypothetical protein [Aquamicrobium ahrensii]|uniref:DUF3077 domain-containing protein n=1 Tax=Aquamicrobium ahrensii TaxID=469551 RepID=A0ABV2KL56_9HYPH
MSADVFSEVDRSGEPVILNRGLQLQSLLTVCQQAAASLENVGEGPYRDSVTASLGFTLELAENIASDLHEALVKLAPKTGGVE